MKIRNPVFHVSQLEKAQIDEETGRPILDEIIVENQEEEYEIENVIAVRQNSETQNIEYLVKWKGYSELENSWEPVEHFSSQAPIKKFLQTLGLNQQAPRSNRSRQHHR